MLKGHDRETVYGDALVFAEARLSGLPVAVAFAGGYARQVEDTVRIHVNTVIAAREAAAIPVNGGRS